jgi:hypothetical protein
MHSKPVFHALQLRASLALIVLILVSTACGPPGSTAPATTTAVETTSSVAAATISEPTPTKAPDVPTSTSVPTPTASPTPPPEPPVQAMDLLAQNLDSGKWSEGQALVDILSVAAGKKSAETVFGDKPVVMEELSGLQVMVIQYLKKNPNALEKQQLEDLLAVLAPSAERIMPYAKPEGTADLGKNVAAAYKPPSSRQEDVDCQEIAYDGFPTPKPGQPAPLCVLYKEFND